MHMRNRILTLAGLFALAALILAGCGSSTSSSSSSAASSAGSTSSGTAATSSPAASPMVASPVASPSAMASPMIASPVASPMASPSAMSTPVTLGTAYGNLENQQSYVLNMTTSGFSQLTALVPGAGSSQQLTLDRSNNNRHLTVNNTGGGKLAELWQVNGKTYADIGTGPIQLNATSGPGAQVGVLLNAPKLYLQSMSGNSSDYTISGTDTVNGISTTVEKANYTVNNPDIAGFLPAGTHQVRSTIWVANQGHYLVKLQMKVTPVNASGTPQAGQTPSTVTMNATQIGSAPKVTAPATTL